MNSFLLSLGIAIALLLIAALAAPFFIDWSSYRGYFEAKAAEIIGRPVAFEGDLEVRLVPFPRLAADAVRVGGPGSGEGIERLIMEAALTPLLNGELQVTELTFERPHAVLRLDPAGRVSWAEAGDITPPMDPDRVTVDRFEIVGGTFDIDDERSGEVIALTDVNVSGTATSLRGPFKVEGGGVVDGERYTMRLATGRMSDDGTGMRVTATVLPAARSMAIEIDGAFLRIDELPTFDGRLIAERPVEDDDTATWRVEGRLTASPETLVLDQMSVRLGAETQNVSLAGAANVRLGADPRFDAVISARQVDLDRAFGAGPDDPVTAREAVIRLGALVDPAVFPLPGHVALDVESTVLSGGLLEGLSVDLLVEERTWSIERATVTAPGRTELGLAGTVGLGGAAPEFDGAARLSTDQATVFANWLLGPRARLPGFAVPAGELEASGQVRIDSAGLVFDRGELTTGDSEIAGSVAYRVPRDGGRGTVAVALTAEALDLSDGGSVSLSGDSSLPRAVEALLAGVDLDVQLRIGTLSLADIEARDLEITGTVSDGDIRIEDLAVGDIGGTRISGGGAIRGFANRPDGALGLQVHARDLDGVAEALRSLGAEAVADRLAARAGALVPADLTLDLTAVRTQTGSRADVTLRGTAGGTGIDGTFGYDGRIDVFGAARIAADVMLSNDSGTVLARQLGLTAPEPALGALIPAGEVALTASGRPNDAVDFRIETAGIGVSGTAEGSARWPVPGGREVTGTLDARIAGAEPLLALAGLDLPGQDATPLAVNAAVSATDDIWRFSDLTITHDDTEIRGDLNFDLAGPDTTVGGRLETGRIELAWLMGTLLGADAVRFRDVPFGESAWPPEPFDPADRRAWRGRIALSTPALALFDGVVLAGAEGTFSFDRRRLSLDGLTGDLFGGRLTAGVDLTQSDGAMALSGRADLADARLEEIVWTADGRAVASGAVSAGVEVNGRGRSLAALAASLSGTGSFTATDGVLRRLNPNAFDLIVSAADAGLDLEEDRVRSAFAGHLDSGSLRFESMEGAFSISSGVLRASTIHIDARDLTSFASATVDLPVLGIDSEWTLQTQAGADEDGRTREVGVVFAGPLADPSRQIDVNPLLGYLTVRAFEQEVERLERLQSEILERQRLGRELIRQGQERQRREREEQERLDAERAAEDAEAERRAEEERARRESERAADEAERRETRQPGLQEPVESFPLPAPQLQGGTAGSFDETDLERRIREILSDIPSERDAPPSSSADALARQPSGRESGAGAAPMLLAPDPQSTQSATRTSPQSAPPLNAPITIAPQTVPTESVAPQAVPGAPLGSPAVPLDLTTPQPAPSVSGAPVPAEPVPDSREPAVRSRTVTREDDPAPVLQNPLAPTDRVFR